MPISAKERKRLPKSSFALPSQRKYPINTKRRAKAALRYAGRKDTAGSFSTVARKVYKRYPSLRSRGTRPSRKKRKGAKSRGRKKR